MLKLLISNIKMMFRNRQNLFWSLAFPLIFTVIFGFFFGSGNMNAGTVGLVNQSESPLATGLEKTIKEAEVFKVVDYQSTEAASAALKDAKVNVVLTVPADFGLASANQATEVLLLTDPGYAQVTATVHGFVNSYLTQVNYQIQNAKPVYTIKQQQASDSGFSYFDYILIGLIGMALMNSSIQGLAIGVSKYREDKILKRITTTPLPTWKFITAEVLARLVLNVVQIGLILAVGVYGFKGSITGNLPMLLALALAGTVLFQLIGFFIVTVTKNTDAAEGMATAVTVPMMFLSGVFFPIDQLPSWLYGIVKYLPLSPLLHTMRGAALEGESPLSNPTNLIIIGGWILLLTAFTVWRFRMTEE